MNAPDESVISKLKVQHKDRALHLVEMTDGEESLFFVLSGPNREEWRKYTREMTESERDVEKMTAAIERAALAQIRWPDREEVKQLFDTKPGIVSNFGEELSKAAGSHVEVRTKKL